MTTGLGGFVRQIDRLGRVCLPAEWRHVHDIRAGAHMELIPARDGALLLQRYTPGGACLFCGNLEALLHFAGRSICRRCAAEVGAAATT